MAEINGQDLGSLDKVAERPSVIKVIRDHHHRVARLIAEGKRTGEVAAEVGLTVSRVSILKSDPAFRDLIEHYRERVNGIADQIFADVHRKAELLRANALDVMNERYEDNPETISHEQARQDLLVTNEMLENKPSVSLHGNLKDLPLAQVVNMRRARADEMERQAAASGKLLGEAATGPGSNNSPAERAVLAPTSKD